MSKKIIFFINYFYKLILKLNLSKKIIDLNIYIKLINKNKFILYYISQNFAYHQKLIVFEKHNQDH